MKYTIDSANTYILENKHKVNSYYKGIYHFSPEIGWINDPNGLVYFNNEYHLFYQYYPYDIEPGPMHWGYAVSRDLLTFEHKGVYLSPLNQEEESGCWSGSSIIDNDELYITYTRHFEKDDIRKEEQYLFPFDNPKDLVKIVSDDELPEGCDTRDFRDPHIIKKGEYFYLFVGSKNIHTNKGNLLIFRSKTLNNFKYHFQINSLNIFGDMGECPDYFYSNGYDCLIVSAIKAHGEEHQYLNPNGSTAIVCHIDFENKKFELVSLKEIDRGDGFYAPKLIQNTDKNIMVAWMEMWGKEIPTQKDHLWAGSFTFPRSVEVRDGEFYQYPIDDIKRLYKNTFSLSERNSIKRNADLYVTYKDEFSLTLKGKDENYSVRLYSEDGYIYLDTRNSNNLNGYIRRLDNKYLSEINLRILLDSSSIEIFVNEGKEAISARIYLESEQYEVISSSFESFIIHEI